MQPDEFLEAELSQEPQVGFIIGVGASDVAGVLLPIATSLTYNLGAGKLWLPVRPGQRALKGVKSVGPLSSAATRKRPKRLC